MAEETPEQRRERFSNYRKKYKLLHPDKVQEAKKNYLLNNPEKRKESTKKYRDTHKKRVKEAALKWVRENPDKVIKIKNKFKELRPTYDSDYQKKRRATDIAFNLKCKMHYAVWRTIRDKKGFIRWEKLVGYNSDKLIQRLKETMPNGYGWDDVLTGKLHIDHIIPVSAFNITSPNDIDFKKCYALTNLRLLPASENLRKHAKLNEPFQPSLAMAV